MPFFRNVSLTLAANLGITAIGLITSVLLARTLGPTGRGLMATVLLWPTVLGWASSLSLGHANAYFGASEPQMRRRLFANSFWAGLFLGGVAGGSGLLILLHFLPLTHEQRFLLTISMILMPVSLWGEAYLLLLNSTSRFGPLNLIRMAVPFATLSLLIFFWMLHAISVTTALLATWVGSWLALGLTLWFLAGEGCIGFRPDLPLLRRTLRYGLHVHVGNCANIANGRLDQLMMTAVVPPKVLGLYAFAVAMSEILNQATGAIAPVLLPKVAEMTDDNARRMISTQSGRWTLIVGFFCAVALFWAAPFLVNLVWGARFMEAVPTLRVLLPGSVALALAGTLCTSLRAAGRPLAATYATLASLAVMIPFLLLLLPRLGIVGAGLASTAAYIVQAAVALFYFGRVFGRDSLAEMRPTRSDWSDVRRVVSRLWNARQARVPAKS